MSRGYPTIGWHHLLFIWIVLLPASIQGQVSWTPASIDYWKIPIPFQDPLPPRPEACGTCHADKYTDWSNSRHAQAFSPGLIGQIADYTETEAARCIACHAPMADQQEPLFQIGLERIMESKPPDLLANHGVFCAACHLRDGILHAPSFSLPKPGHKRIHNQTHINPLLRDSQFCATCHQFSTSHSINGKPLQDTYREWLDSSYPSRGETCQTCHMPDQAHLFRGIHDPDMVRHGLTINTNKMEETGVIVIRSTGIGHRFPTYIVPRIRVIGILLDSASRPIPSGSFEKTILREMQIENGRWIEFSDTRLEPGGFLTLQVPWQVNGVCGSKIQFRIIVEPEWYYYETVYPALLQELEDGPAQDLIKAAMTVAKDHNYVLFEDILTNLCDN
ncbi:MAG: multiheme c-type cytochrome [Candidatus Thiodiazotropha sp.]